jgi:hypothetical protein
VWLHLFAFQDDMMIKKGLSVFPKKNKMHGANYFPLAFSVN